MFPNSRPIFVPSGLPQEVKEGNLTGSYKFLVPGRVMASTYIGQGAVSMPIDPFSLMGHTDIVQISVRSNSYGRLELCKTSENAWNDNAHWVRAIRLADDCHSYNVQLRKLNKLNNSENINDTLFLEVVRPIQSGQELVLWFSEDVLATMHVRFLVPDNIQDQKKYVCTLCSAIYESPNPLKLHLTLACGKHKIQSLWEKLSHTIKNKEIKNEFNFNLKPLLLIPKQKNAIDLTTADNASQYVPNVQNCTKLQRHNSAFTPFKKTDNTEATVIKNCQYMDKVQTFSLWPTITMSQDYVRTPMHQTADDEAHIETLVSSLGKSKHGHVCLYCGKSYSRKYGLKIHIRTHTGYKPLKCKYCMRPFGDPSNLNKHIRLHAEGNTPYKCELCGKILVRRRDLERHLKSRHMIGNTITTINDDSNEASIDISVEEKYVSIDD